MQVGVIGAGSWGTAVAALAAANGPSLLWSRREDIAAAINATHENPRYVQGFALPERLVASSDLAHVVGSADALAIGVPSHGLRDVLALVATPVSYTHLTLPTIYSV